MTSSLVIISAKRGPFSSSLRCGPFADVSIDFSWKMHLYERKEESAFTFLWTFALLNPLSLSLFVLPLRDHSALSESFRSSILCRGITSFTMDNLNCCPTDWYSCVERVGSEFVLVHQRRSTHRLCDRNQKVIRLQRTLMGDKWLCWGTFLYLFIKRWEGFEEDVPIGTNPDGPMLMIRLEFHFLSEIASVNHRRDLNENGWAS